jgi:MYXO-CTERM domain-containing protein
VFLQDAESLTAEVDVPYTVTGCMHADAGSTYTASYGPIAGIGEPMWMPFVTDAPVVNGELRLDFVPPDITVDSSIKVRVDVTDPNLDVFTAFTPGPIAVVDGGTGGETDGGTGDPSDDTSDPTDPTNPTDPSDPTNGSNDNGDDTSNQDGGVGGFGCRAGDSTPLPAALMLLLLGLVPRHRRRR